MLNGRQLAAVTGVAVAGLMIAYMRGIPLAAGFSLGLGLLMILILKHGAEWSGVLASMKRGAGHTKEVVWILLLIGLLIPAWTASGTIPYMIHLGLGLLNPAYFLSFTFIFAAVISMTIGTSTGTLSAIGIPLLGMASFLQIPLPLVAGALASGAFVGDRSSPFSSAHQLVAASAGVSSAAQLKAMLPTTVAAVAASLLFYAAADWFGQWRTSVGEAVTTAISDRFVLHPALIVPPVLLIASVLLRLRIRTAFLLAIAAAIALGSLLQHLTPAAWLHALWSGYDNGESEQLRGKGISDMFGLVLLIAMAGAFNGILEEYRILQPYMAKVLGPSVSLFRSTFRTLLFGLGLGLVSCTQTLPIMMSGRSLLPIWSQRHEPVQLARVVADTSLIFAALIPWNMLAILCSTVMGLPVESYAPYAVFLWTLPLLTLLHSRIRGRKASASLVP